MAIIGNIAYFQTNPYNDFVSFFGKLTLLGLRNKSCWWSFRDSSWGKKTRIEASKHQQTRSTRKTGEKHERTMLLKLPKLALQEFAWPSQWCCDFVRNTTRSMGWTPRIGKGKRKEFLEVSTRILNLIIPRGVSYGFISCEFVQVMTCSGRHE